MGKARQCGEESATSGQVYVISGVEVERAG